MTVEREATRPTLARDRTVTVLHVDDEPSFAELVATFLEREDDRFDVHTTTSVPDALARLADLAVDCVVSDHDMPGKTGLDFLRDVRETRPDLPFILYTGKGSEEVASDAISAGVTDYLQKEQGTSQYTVLANRIRNAVERVRVGRERERQLDAIQAAQEGISILDADYRYIYVNDAYADLYGYDPAEFVDEPWERVYPDAVFERVLEEIVPQIEESGRWHGECVGLRADSTTFPKEKTVATTGAGEIVCTVRDVSDRREREREWETLVDNLPGVVYRRCAERDWPLDDVRGDVEALTGYTAAELRERDASFVRDADRVRVSAAIESALEDRERYEAAYRIETKGGTEKWLWERGQGVYDAGGELAALEGFATDVTAWKRSMLDLHEERALLEDTLDALDDVFYVLGTDGGLERWNDRLLDVTGYSAAEAAEMRAVDFFPEDERDRVAAAIDETFTDGTVVVEADLLTADGRRVPYEFTGARLIDRRGVPTGLVGTGRNLARRVLAEED